MQVHPELRGLAEAAAEAQGEFGGNRRLFPCDALDQAGRYVEQPRLFSAAHGQVFDDLAQQGAGMDTVLARRLFRGCVPLSVELREFLLAPPQQFDFGWRQHPGSGRGTELLIQ